MKEYVSHGTDETQQIARKYAAELITRHHGEPIIIALEGELGAGKTTFTQAFIAALGVEERVKSPTFVLMKEYPLMATPGYHALYHLDCYRLRDSKDLIPLGIEKILMTKGVIVLIEWAERVEDILPRNKIVVHIDHIAEQTRNIKILENPF